MQLEHLQTALLRNKKERKNPPTFNSLLHLNEQNNQEMQGFGQYLRR